MYITALDVGVTTGVVVARVGFRQVPEVICCGLLNFDDVLDRDQHSHAKSYFTLPQEIDPKPRQTFVDRILVEYPLVHAKSNTFDRCMAVRLTVSEILRGVDLHWNIPIQEVTPSEWKQTPAKKVNIFDMKINQPGGVSWGLGDSKHVQDAGAILYWYSFFGTKS